MSDNVEYIDIYEKQPPKEPMKTGNPGLDAALAMNTRRLNAMRGHADQSATEMRAIRHAQMSKENLNA
jgi:hypothetical protein